MKILKRTTVIIFAAVLLIFAAMKIHSVFFTDVTPPVISCADEVIEVSVSAPESELLSGVTATDDVDGDITPSVMIEGVSQLITDDTAKISYIVFDSSDNAAACSRTVRYTDYHKPRFSLTQPLVYSVGSEVSLKDRLTADDVIDGDITSDIRVTAQDLSTDKEGTYSITVQVTNSLGDTSILPLRVVLSGSDGAAPLVELTDYIVYIPAGSVFEPASYIAAAHSESGVPVPASAVSVTSDVDASKPGSYEAAYTYSSGGRSYTAYLAVVVE